MPSHRFRRAHGEAVLCMVAKYFFDRQTFELIVVRCRSTVRIYIADPIGFDSRIFYCSTHYALCSRTSFVGHRDVKRVAAHSVADDLGIDLGTASLRRFKFLQDYDPGAFADHETIAFEVERPGGSLRIIISSRERTH